VINHCEFVGFEVLTTATMKGTFSWDGMPRPVNFPDISEECTASIFRVDEKKSKLPTRSRQLPGLLFSPEDGGGTFLQNIGENLPDYHNSTSQKTVLFIASSVISICICLCSSVFTWEDVKTIEQCNVRYSTFLSTCSER
jgi:hypothetical protein